MARKDSFEAVLGLMLKKLSPEEAKKTHIKVARAALKELQSRQKEPLPYALYVDGALVDPLVMYIDSAGGVSKGEDRVKPFGTIKYVFLRMQQVARYALVTAQELSPVQSGRYKKSWSVIVDRVEMTPDKVPPEAREIIVVNYQPYARKIHMRGARLRNVPPGIVEKLRQMVRRQFGKVVNTELKFIKLQGGYVLKRDYIQIRRSGRRRQRDPKGTELSYPALVITAKF